MTEQVLGFALVQYAQVWIFYACICIESISTHVLGSLNVCFNLHIVNASVFGFVLL